MEKKLHAAANETDWRNKLTKTRIGSVTLPVYLVTASIILDYGSIRTTTSQYVRWFCRNFNNGLVTWNNWWKYSYFETFWRSRNFIFISTINYGLFNQPKCLRLNKYFNETSKLSLFLYCLFGLWKYPWNEPQSKVCHDCPDGIRNDFSNGCWDPCWNAIGLGWKHSLFYIVTPVLAGGIGEGILPLSLGYSAITGLPSEQLVGQLIPATIIGNFCYYVFRFT